MILCLGHLCLRNMRQLPCHVWAEYEKLWGFVFSFMGVLCAKSWNWKQIDKMKVSIAKCRAGDIHSVYVCVHIRILVSKLYFKQ